MRLAGIETAQLIHWRYGPVRVFAQFGDFSPVDVAVETNADPPAPAHVRRAEKSIRRCGEQVLLSALWRGTPQMREPLFVVPIGPEHHELLSDEEGGRTVAEPFCRPGQRTADPPDSGLHVDGHCPRIGGATASPYREANEIRRRRRRQIGHRRRVTNSS
jgi:hypothetical protein